MSLNQVNSSGELERVAGLVNSEKINEMYEAFPSGASASNKLVTESDVKDKMSCYTWGTNKTLRAVFYEVTDRGIMPDVTDTVGKRVIARYGNVLINRITQVSGVRNFYWDDTLVLSCPYNDDITKLTDVLEIFVGTTSWQKLVTESDLPPSIPSVHFHGYGNSSETFDISRLNIQQYHTFEITFRAFYAQSGSVTNVKHVYNAASLANPSLAQEIYNTTGVQPTITFNNDGSKLTSMTITLPGEMNTYDLNVSL